MQYDVIIVGAGASGLVAARELGKTGKRVLILEARDRTGGRIYPLPEEVWGYPAEGGAEFVHGPAPITRGLVDEAGITLNHAIEWWDVRDGEATLIGHASHLDKVSPNDPLLLTKIQELKEDMTLADFLDTYFPGPEFANLRYITEQRVEGYDAADPKRASAFALRDEMLDESGWQQHNVKEGYGQLVRFLEDECTKCGVELVLNKQVKVVEWGSELVRVFCTDKSVYEGAKVLVTVPLPILKDIIFTPPIPEELRAVEQIGYGPVIKILIRFKTKWWAGIRQQQFERMFFMFSKEKVPTWWTQYPEPHLTLTGWVAGLPAEALSNTPAEEILNIAFQSLSNIFKISINELRTELLTYKIVNWLEDPFAKGAYSYITPEASAAIEKLNKPLAGKLFFGGEGVSQSDSTGTVESALYSGLQSAQRILSS